MTPRFARDSRRRARRRRRSPAWRRPRTRSGSPATSSSSTRAASRWRRCSSRSSRSSPTTSSRSTSSPPCSSAVRRRTSTACAPGTLLMTWVGAAYLSRIVPGARGGQPAVRVPEPRGRVQGHGRRSRRAARQEARRKELHFARLDGSRRAAVHQQQAADQDDRRLQGAQGPAPAERDAPRDVPGAGGERGGDGRQRALLGARAEGDGRAGEPLHDHPRRALYRGPEIPLEHRALLRLHRDHRQPQAVRGAEARIPESDPRSDRVRRSPTSASSPSTPIARRSTRSARRCSTTRSPRRCASRCATRRRQ